MGGGAVKRVWLTASVLFAVSIIVRLPFLSQVLINWDAVQFALGTRDFNLELHQPHPPGYILFIAWGDLLNRVTHDPNLSFALTSVVAASGAVALLYLLAQRVFGDRQAIIGAALFGASPLLWYYSRTALTYATEAFFGLLLVYLCWRVAEDHESRFIAPSAVALALAGGVRQSTLVLMLPLWLWAVSRHGWPALRRASLLAGGLCLLWLAPLVWLTGGPSAYISLCLQLFGLVGERTSIIYAGMGGFAGNAISVVGSLLLSLNLKVFVFVPFVRRRHVWPFVLSRSQRTFLCLWLAPSLMVFTFGHIGQLGYMLLVLPAVYLLIGPCLEVVAPSAVRSLLSRWFGQGRWKQPALVLTVLLVASNFGTWWLSEAAAQTFLPSYAAMLDPGENDQFWKKLTLEMYGFPEENTIVLAAAAPDGSFRHAGYYLPTFKVFGVAEDRRGHTGFMFEASDGKSDYSVAGLDQASRVLRLPEHTQHILILDEKVANLVVPSQMVQKRKMTPHRMLYTIERSDLPSLVFVRDLLYVDPQLIESRMAWKPF